MIDKKKFNAEMAANDDKHKDLAVFLDISEQAMSRKFNSVGGADYTRSEIERVKMKYNLTPQRVDEIFFAKNT